EERLSIHSAVHFEYAQLAELLDLHTARSEYLLVQGGAGSHVVVLRSGDLGCGGERRQSQCYGPASQQFHSRLLVLSSTHRSRRAAGCDCDRSTAGFSVLGHGWDRTIKALTTISFGCSPAGMSVSRPYSPVSGLRGLRL